MNTQLIKTYTQELIESVQDGLSQENQASLLAELKELCIRNHTRIMTQSDNPRK